MTATARLRLEIEHAAAALAEAGVGSPRADAEELAAHAAGTSRGRLWVLDDVDDEFCVRYAELVAARSQRIPLQHIVGTAPLGPVTVEVGPGVFIPRPETEGLLEWASAQPLAAAPGDRGPVHGLGCAGAGPVEVLAGRTRGRRRRLR